MTSSSASLSSELNVEFNALPATELLPCDVEGNPPLICCSVCSILASMADNLELTEERALMIS